MFKFTDGCDFCDFAFFLDLLDPDNGYTHLDVEIAYHKYDTIRYNMPKDCEDFREYMSSCLDKSLSE